MKLLNFITRLITWISFLAASAMTANAAERIMTITSDAYPGQSFSMNVTRADDGSVQTLIINSPDGNRSYSLAQLRSQQILLQASGHKVVTVNVESDFTAEKGGHADIRYLTNGLSGTYKTFRVLIDVEREIIVRGPNGPFTRVFMKKATMLGKTIGVSQIIPSP